MTFTIKGSHIIAFLITVFIGVYMYFGNLEIGGQTSAENELPPIAERQQSSGEDLFRVSYVELQPQMRAEKVVIRGRTQADARIPIKAETAGILEQRLVDRGDFVKSGDLVCVIDRGAREISLESAKASLEQANAEFIANKELRKKGFATDTKMRELTATLNAAKAQLRQAEIELERTEVRANASGMVMDPIAEQGDVLGVGNTCVTIVDTDPMFFIGQVSESEISSIQTGMEAQVELITGAKTKGTVNYISPAADAQTRTFRVEIKLNETATDIRDGLTATSRISMEETQAFRISPSWLTLSDEGQLGLKVLTDEDKVSFTQVNLLAQGNNGFWINNMKAGTRVITLGQEFVASGEKVEPVMQEAQLQETAQ